MIIVLSTPLPLNHLQKNNLRRPFLFAPLPPKHLCMDLHSFPAINISLQRTVSAEDNFASSFSIHTSTFYLCMEYHSLHAINISLRQTASSEDYSASSFPLAPRLPKHLCMEL
ncbi:hypothetical protein NPIL_526281 [Nephila pilipes]|uniref:Uncharacterized protein n=1 Tax=Nephila pilipes TaxID=299642 RepID=A0A8X6PZS4_NEPPI|nr:hypothetical protein NPIL_526281 [Nephila pilipes]